MSDAVGGGWNEVVQCLHWWCRGALMVLSSSTLPSSVPLLPLTATTLRVLGGCGPFTAGSVRNTHFGLFSPVPDWCTGAKCEQRS